jgi:Uma2 family endonuclease
MRARVADYREAVDHLPEGGTLVFQDVTWEEYEQLLNEMEDRPGVRITYDEGRLEIMSPRPEHEEYKRFIERMIDTLSDELDINVEPRGSATWKRERGKGAGGDTCYYVANAERIIGKRDIDLKIDPPPDLIVEVDSTSESLGKFVIYSAFGVPEIWRYDVKRSRFHMYELQGTAYVEIPSSRSFPILKVDALAAFIDQSKIHGQKAALAGFRQWLKKTR